MYTLNILLQKLQTILYFRGNKKIEKKAEQQKQKLKSFEKEGQLPNETELFDEYIEPAIQFGYITMFGWCWPLCAFCCLLHNELEVRSDAYKTCFFFKRPVPKYAMNVGAWQVQTYRI